MNHVNYINNSYNFFILNIVMDNLLIEILTINVNLNYNLYRAIQNKSYNFP
jgi:hypothetical protein